MDLIAPIVDWYGGLPSDYQDINELMYNRQRLVSQVYGASVKMQKARKQWKIKETKAEIEIYQARILHHDKGVSKSENIAKANSEISQNERNEAEANFYEIKYSIDAANKVLESMHQHIAILRAEKSNSKYD